MPFNSHLDQSNKHHYSTKVKLDKVTPFQLIPHSNCVLITLIGLLNIPIFVLKKGFRMNQKRPIAPVSSPVFSDLAYKASLSKSPLAQLTRKPPAKVVQKQPPAPRDPLAPLTNHPEEAKKNTPVSTESSIYRSTGTLVIQNKSSASMP